MKNKYAPTNNYKRFCDQGIDLATITCLDPLEADKWMEIESDDFCVICGADGFYTDDNDANATCLCCLKPMCVFCIADSDADMCVNCFG